MNIERHDQFLKPAIDVEFGQVIEYKGVPHIRTIYSVTNFGCVKIKYCNLNDGSVEELPENMMVKVLKAKVVIE